MNTYAASALALVLLAGCSSPEPASEPAEQKIDSLELLQEAVDSLKRNYASALRSGKVKEGELLEVQKIKFQPQRGVRWKRHAKSLEEHLTDQLREAGLPVAEAGQEAQLGVTGLVRLTLQSGGGWRQVEGRASLQVLRGLTIRCNGNAGMKWQSRLPEPE